MDPNFPYSFNISRIPCDLVLLKIKLMLTRHKGKKLYPYQMTSMQGVAQEMEPPTRHVQFRKFIILPDSHFYRLWRTILAALVLITVWVSLFEFGFLEKPEKPLSIMYNVVNGFFAIDILLTFFVPYHDKTTTNLLVDNPKQIAWRYARTWLLLDVLSTIPSQVAINLLAKHFHFYGLFIMLRLWRLHTVNALFARLEKDRNFNYSWVRVTKLVFVTVFFTHFAGCFYYRLAADYDNPGRTWIGHGNSNFKNESLWVSYVTSMYWSVTALVGNSHGAQNISEMTFIIFYTCIKYGLLTYVTVNITILVVHITKKTVQYRDVIQEAMSYAERNKLSPHLQEQIFAHIQSNSIADSEGLQQPESIDALPKAIRSSISRFRFSPILDNAYLFNGVSKEFLFHMVAEVKAEYFAPKTCVILQDAAPTDFYILVSGEVELLVIKNGNEQVVRVAKAGDLCGEIGVLCYKPQLFEVRTKSISELLRLDRTTFLHIVKANIGDGAVIVNNLLQRMKVMGDPIIQRLVFDTQQMLASGRTDLPLGYFFGLCFATLRGYNLLLDKLLIKGLHPNEADNNGRTALHIAASNGSENCVRPLLQYGADPNVKDSKGSVPLWEAILGNHVTVIRLLTDKGATLSSGDEGQFSCIAVEQNNLDLLKQIVCHKGDVTRVFRNERSTALHVAAFKGKIKIVEFLLEQGSKIDQRDHHGRTPLDLANQCGHENIIMLLSTITSTSNTEDKRAHGSLDMTLPSRFKSNQLETPANPGCEPRWPSYRARNMSNRPGLMAIKGPTL